MNILRLTAVQADVLARHLMTSDGHEAVALGVCGRAEGPDRSLLALRRILPVPHAVCDRAPDSVRWPTRALYDLLPRAAEEGSVLVKFHSHPAGGEAFSACDDQSDREVMAACARRLGAPQASVVLTRGGRIFGRMVDARGTFNAIDRIMVVGDDILLQDAAVACRSRAFDMRHRQLFGDRTTDLIGRLRIGVVGISGTGSPLVEMLARLGVAGLVLVDDDVVEPKNLNRIYGATARDAAAMHPKTEVARRHVRRMGLGVEVQAHAARADDPAAMAALATCDVLFGCMDGIAGRDALNRLATRTITPYFDLGVRIDADGSGGVSSVSAATHYLQPGGSSLRSRGVYSDEELYAEHLHRSDRSFYEDQLERGYIKGVREDRPAVISINTATAAMAVNELLARLHPYRSRPNAEFATQRMLFSHGRLAPQSDGEPDELLSQEIGVGLWAGSSRQVANR